MLSARFLVFCGWFSLMAVQVVEARQPNIILIFADDLGWRDTGYNGTGYIETPVLDQLAKDGMVFDNAYAAAGNCSPSRACLMSGQYTPRHGVYAVRSTNRGPKQQQRLIPIANTDGLAEQHVTMAEALKEAGYATALFGKWHLDGKDGALPRQQGFEVTFETKADGTIKDAESNSPQKIDPEDPKAAFTLTAKACEFMETNRERPFFCYLAHHAIHTKLQARQQTLERFEAKKREADSPAALYAACTFDLDASIGLLLAKLQELHLEQDTLVIFTSDNGATPASSQEPLRGNKGGYYEGGIRAPFIARWPGVIAAGSRSSTPVINLDCFPTFLAVAEVSVPATKTLDGENLLPLLKNDGPLKRESIFWHFPGYLDVAVTRGRERDVQAGFRTSPVSVIRKGNWKLHLFHEEWQLDRSQESPEKHPALELYDLSQDIGEHHNLAEQQPAKRDELLQELLQWMKQTAAPVPSQPNPDYKPEGQKPKRKGKKKQAAEEM